MSDRRENLSPKELLLAETIYITLCRENNTNSITINHIKKYSQTLEVRSSEVEEILERYFVEATFDDIDLARFLRCVACVENEIPLEDAFSKQYDFQVKSRTIGDINAIKQERVVEVSASSDSLCEGQLLQTLEEAEHLRSQIEDLADEDEKVPALISQLTLKEMRKNLTNALTLFNEEIAEIQTLIAGELEEEKQNELVEEVELTSKLIEQYQETVQVTQKLEKQLGQQSKQMELQKETNLQLKAIVEQNKQIIEKNAEKFKPIHNFHEIVEQSFLNNEFISENFEKAIQEPLGKNTGSMIMNINSTNQLPTFQDQKENTETQHLSPNNQEKEPSHQRQTSDKEFWDEMPDEDQIEHKNIDEEDENL